MWLKYGGFGHGDEDNDESLQRVPRANNTTRGTRDVT